MAEPMISARSVTIDGPDLQDSGPLWNAGLELGLPSGAKGEPPVVRNASIRLLVQRADPVFVGVERSDGLPFHEPLLLSAAVTTQDLTKASPLRIRILSQEFKGVKLADDPAGPAYSELKVAPNGQWPPRGGLIGKERWFARDEDTQRFEIATPRLRAIQGHIRVAAELTDAQSKLTKLGVKWSAADPGRALIFGCIALAPHPIDGAPAKRAMVLTLTPSGIEFDALVPDPFGGLGATALELRLRLATVPGSTKNDLRLELVGGKQKNLDRLRQAFAGISRELAQDEGPLALRFADSPVPPLSWPLTLPEPPSNKPYNCGAPGEVPAVDIRPDAVSVEILTRPDPGGGEPGVAEVLRPSARLLNRKPAEPVVLKIFSAPPSPAPAPNGGPTVTVTWTGPAPGRAPSELDVSKFDGVTRGPDLRDRLAAAWTASGAVAPGGSPSHAFIALDRGWVQAPLPAAVRKAEDEKTEVEKKDEKKKEDEKKTTSPTPSTVVSAFRGGVRLELAGPKGAQDGALDDFARAGLDVVMAQTLEIVVTGVAPNRTIKLTLGGACGSLDGALWVGAASPSPEEILPPRDGGPSALISPPVLFGVKPDEDDWTLSVAAFKKAGVGSLVFPGSAPTVADKAGPLLAWRPHDSLALVAAAGMTRTAENALRPSASRQLFPMELDPATPRVLTYAARLPSFSLQPKPATDPKPATGGGDQWRWPWPSELADGPGGSASSPTEGPGVSMVCLTLPGVEFTAAEPMTPFSEMRASLRFDLPLLDELNANTRAPKPKTPAPSQSKQDQEPPNQRPPTALDLPRLSAAWAQKARDLARARSDADRVVLKESGGEVRLWHPLGKAGDKDPPVDKSVRGLVEPYLWATSFVFQNVPPGPNGVAPKDGIALGAYSLGKGADGTVGWRSGEAALGGFSGRFTISAAGRLVADRAGAVVIDGFAASSFASRDGDKDFLQDSRGLALAREPDITGKASFRLMQAHDDKVVSSRLMTLVGPVDITLGTETAHFWCRDLPLKTAGDGYEFDDSGGLESADGPDPGSMSRERLSKAIYEWRLYPHDAGKALFEIPLGGPFAARPLRLMGLHAGPDGTVVSLKVLASVQLAARADDGAGPFGEDDAYATGNIVVMSFVAVGDGLTLESIERRGGDRARPGRVVFATQARISNSADGASENALPVEFSFTFKVAAGALSLGDLQLRARLFGQSTTLALPAASLPSGALQATFAGLGATDFLDVKTVEFSWGSGEFPSVRLDCATTSIPLRGDSPKLKAFAHTFGSPDLAWLGLKVSEGVRESVDHASGVVTFEIDATVAPGKALFRGFLLPAGRLRGAIGMLFAPQEKAAEGRWPALTCVFAEIAFDADGAVEAMPVRAIRHRHAGLIGPDGKVMALSRLLVDASFAAGRRSAVSWPVAGLELDSSAFAPAPDKMGDWTRTLGVTDTAALAHTVSPRLSAHELPLGLLGLGTDEAVVLSEPWRFQAVTDHKLEPVAGSAIRWTSIDQLCLVDIQSLTALAKAVPGSAPADSFAFMARYKAGADDDDVRIAGVVRRSLAMAGFPIEPLLIALAQAPPAATAALALAGGAVVDVSTDPAKGLGVTLTPQWLVAWAAADAPGLGNVLGPLAKIPQATAVKTMFRIATFDAAAGAPKPHTGACSVAFGAQDGAEPWLHASLEKMLGEPPEPQMVADQGFIDPVDAPAGPVLQRPLFARTLLALAAVIKAFNAKTAPGFATRFTSILAGRSAANPGLRLAVSAWPADFVSSEAAAPAMALVVIDDRTVTIERLPDALAAALADPAGPDIQADGRARHEASLRALGVSTAPRIVLLARIDATYLDLAATPPGSRPAVEQRLAALMSAPPNIRWLSAPIASTALPVSPYQAGWSDADTVFASAALGWPEADRAEDLSNSQAVLGDEAVRRNESLAWAGRVRSVGWSAKAWSAGAASESESKPDPRGLAKGAYIAMGQRVAFRRRASVGFRAPADRSSVLVAPRSRVPVVEAMTAAFDELLKSATANGAEPTSGLAPMLPGSIETTVTGQRPGVLVVQHEGVLLTGDRPAFDPGDARFGRPASRGPLIVRQVRTPRSSGFEVGGENLALRRRTFVGADEKDAKGLRPFKLIRGPGAVVRDYRDGDFADGPSTVTLQVVEPAFGWLTPNWNGRLRLRATVVSGSAANVLARLGLLPSSTEAPRVDLRVGEAALAFDEMTWAPTLDKAGKTVKSALLIEFSRSMPSQDTQLADIRHALAAATADTAVRLVIRGRSPGAAIRLASAGAIDLKLATEQPLIAGPPRILVFDLAHIPSRQRWLPLSTCTLAFADPAYDRELGSPAATGEAPIGDILYRIGADRAEYDPGSTVHFAFWRAEGAPVAPPTPACDLIVMITPANGAPSRQLCISGVKARTLDAGCRYEVKEIAAYAIPLPALREATTSATTVALRRGDRITLTVASGADSVSVNVGIVEGAVISPSAATYGVATLIDGGGVEATLFATAPLPQVIEFPDLSKDLVAGHVRRRALFLWSFATTSSSEPGAPYAALIKVDRTGGGQLPVGKSDFLGCDG